MHLFSHWKGLETSEGIPDVSKMLGKDLSVTLASSINIHRHSPFGPMHWQDLSVSIIPS